MIDCDEFRKFVDPYVDGEFDDRGRAEFDAHMAVCPDCRRFFEQKSWFLEAVRPCLRRPTTMSEDQRCRLTAKLRAARAPERRRRMMRRVAPLSTVAAAAAVFLFVTPLTGFAPVIDEAVDQHCQAMPVEVPSPEPREIDDWFSGKVPFDMNAPRFRDQRVSLLGGRLSRVGQQRAAYLVYGVGAHKVSVLVFDGRELKLDSGQARAVANRKLRMHDARGYRVAVYQKGPLAYAVTSDLPEGEMLNLIGSAF